MYEEEMTEEEIRTGQEKANRVATISRKIEVSRKALKRVEEIWDDAVRNGGPETIYRVLNSEIDFAKEGLDRLRDLLREERKISSGKAEEVSEGKEAVPCTK